MRETKDHILMVDDDGEIRRLLRDYLERNGFRATAVADGRAMWRTLDAGRYDLVVLDLMLPGEDGLSLCRDLRARSRVPVIMLTALGEETDRIVGLEMVKPLPCTVSKRAELGENVLACCLERPACPWKVTPDALRRPSRNLQRWKNRPNSCATPS